jgi:hypothetical protein
VRSVPSRQRYLRGLWRRRESNPRNVPIGGETSPELVYIERKDGGPRRLLRVLGRRQENGYMVLELAPQRRRCQRRGCLHLVDVPGSFCPDQYKQVAA